MANINVVVLSGNLTRDPEVSEVGGRKVAKLGLAVNSRKKEGEEWVDVPHFFDVSVWSAPGGPADWCEQQLHKGSPVVVSGRLQWRSWEDAEGNKRSAVDVVAHDVVLPPRADNDTGGRDDADGIF